MASKYGAYVHGVDLSVNMVTTALERAFAAKDGHKVSLVAHLFLRIKRMSRLEASLNSLPECTTCGAAQV